jgi:hypothetical protein
LRAASEESGIAHYESTVSTRPKKSGNNKRGHKSKEKEKTQSATNKKSHHTYNKQLGGIQQAHGLMMTDELLRGMEDWTPHLYNDDGNTM